MSEYEGNPMQTEEMIWPGGKIFQIVTDENRHLVCTECSCLIQTMAFKGTGVCSELCRKRRDGENKTEEARVSAT